VKRLLLALFILVSIVGCSACEPAGAPVTVVGDSITAWSSDAVRASLTRYSVTLSATPGINLADGTAQLVLPAVATRPSVLVVELGVNTAGAAWDASAVADLAHTLDSVRSIPCVVWVVPTAQIPAPLYDPLGVGYIHDRIETMKVSMRKMFPSYPNVHLADWGPTEIQHPEWFYADRMHLSDSGKVAYGDYIKGQVSGLC
jgi:hypothetical protein